MNNIIVGFGIVFLIVGLVTGYASGIGLTQPVSPFPTSNWLVEAIVAAAFMITGGLMVVLGIKKF